MPSIEDEQARRRAAVHLALHGEAPARRRRPVLLGGGALVAVSPVAVGAGLFVPGFAAFGLGALLLLLPPPRTRSEPKRRSPFRSVGRAVGLGGRGAVVLARGGARLVARTFMAMERFAAGRGREGVARIARASYDGMGRVLRASLAAASRTWSVTRVVAPRVWRRLVAASRSLSREGCSAALRAWQRVRPTLLRGMDAALAGSARLARELAALARAVSERLPPASR